MDHEMDPLVMARLEAVRELLKRKADDEVAVRRVMLRDVAMSYAFFATMRSLLDAIEHLMPEELHDRFGLGLMDELVQVDMDVLEANMLREIREE